MSHEYVHLRQSYKDFTRHVNVSEMGRWRTNYQNTKGCVPNRYSKYLFSDTFNKDLDVFKEVMGEIPLDISVLKHLKEDL